MANFCLPHNEADNFKEKLLSGDIDPEKLIAMTSRQRHQLFAGIVGEANAGPVNTLFESKLLLKNQQAGMIAWAKSVMGPKDPKVRQGIIDKIEKMKKALNPDTEDAFLDDLVSERLGMRVSFDEAKRISDLADEVKRTKEDMDAGGDRMDYGRAVVNLRNYVEDLKLEVNKLQLSDLKARPVQTIAKAAMRIPGMAKSIKASLDASYLFRQGFKALAVHPEIWRRNAIQSFRDMATAWSSHEVMNEVNADIVSRPTYPLMLRAKLPLAIHEEAFPETLQEKVPGIGRFFRMSDHAFTAFNQRNRADIFDKLIQMAEHDEVNLNDQELQNIGRFAASMTSRGYLGRAEKVAEVVNTLFFSPRMLKATVDTFTHPFTGAGANPIDKWISEGTGGSSFVRKQAIKSLARQVAVSLGILLIARAMLGQAGVDFDLRGADAGKIKIKNKTYANIVAAMLADMMGIATNTYGGVTRYDVTGGASSLITLVSRFLSGKSKSTTTGKVHPLNSGKYGSQTKLDVLEQFIGNKASPAGGVARDVAKGETFKGERPTISNEAKELFAPLVYTTLEELLQDQKNPHPPKPKR